MDLIRVADGWITQVPEDLVTSGKVPLNGV